MHAHARQSLVAFELTESKRYEPMFMSGQQYCLELVLAAGSVDGVNDSTIKLLLIVPDLDCLFDVTLEVLDRNAERFCRHESSRPIF